MTEFTHHQSWKNRNILGMSLASFFSDASHEMATSVLPGFLAVMGAPPAALGIIEGVADAVSSFVKLWAGWMSDRVGHRKALVTIGYALTGSAMALFAAASDWLLVFIGRTIGWFGKGFRGPIRDAMLVESVEPSDRGKAFGLHRFGDTLGAIAGPLIGVGLLEVWQTNATVDPSQPFRNIFLLTLIPGMLSALTFAVATVERRPIGRTTRSFRESLSSLPNRFRRFLWSVGIFGLGDFAPTFLILAAVQLLEPEYGMTRAAQLAGLMYVVRNVSYALASFPIGALSDRIPRTRVIAAGYGLAVITTLGFGIAFIFDWHSPIYLFVLFSLAGTFTATEDTLERAITADLVACNLRGTGMGALGTANGIGDLVASLGIGWCWTLFSPVAGFLAAAGFMFAGTVMMVRTDRSLEKTSAP